MNPRYWLASILVLASGAGRADAPIMTSGEAFELNGYANVEFRRMLSQEGDGDPNGAFDMSELDVVLNWHGSDRLRVAADVGYTHGVDTAAQYGSVVLQYGWAEYAIRDWARVRAGKMFIPFGIYNEFHTAKTAILSVKEPRATGTTSLMGARDLFGRNARPYPRWGTGVAVLGDAASPVGQWDYVVAVTNGNSLSVDPYQKDENRQKAVTARVRLEPTGHLEIGASYYTDWVNELDSLKRPTDNLTRLSSYGVQVAWRPGRVLGIEAEYTGTSTQASDASGLRGQWSHGAYLQVFGAFSETWIPYARYEWLDPDTAVGNNVAQIYLGGLAVRLPGNLLLKAEVDTFRVGENNALYDGGLGNYTQLYAAAAVGF